MAEPKPAYLYPSGAYGASRDATKIPVEGPIPEIKWLETGDIEFTDRYPKFYLDVLERGTDFDKQKTAIKIFNCCHANAWCATKMKEYICPETFRSALEIIHEYRKYAEANSLNDRGNIRLTKSILHQFGYEGYEKSGMSYCKPGIWEGVDGNLPPQPMGYELKEGEEVNDFTSFGIKGNGYYEGPAPDSIPQLAGMTAKDRGIRGAFGPIIPESVPAAN